MGVLLVGFASATPSGVAGATFHLLNHGLFKALMFLCAGGIVHATGVTKLSQMGGLARRRPITTVAFTVGAMSIAGVPRLQRLRLARADPRGPAPRTGHLRAGARRAGDHGGGARAGGVPRLLPASFGTVRAPRAATPRDADQPCRIGFSCVALGVLPYLVVHHVGGPAAAILLHPSAYAAAVLGGAARCRCASPGPSPRCAGCTTARSTTTQRFAVGGLVLCSFVLLG